MKLLDTIAVSETLTHGDFHTNNVFLLNEEPLLIDLDRLSQGHPMAEISDLYYFYNILGEDDPAVIENFMGFSYDTAKQFFEVFLRRYLDTEDEQRLNDVKEKAAFLCYVRMINKIHKKSTISEEERAIIDRDLSRIAELADRLDTLDF
jgi:Ser/Thr protein kinase RdoA (MazF antagonist)